MYCWIYENYVKDKSHNASKKTILYFNNLSLILDYYRELAEIRHKDIYKMKIYHYGERLYSLKVLNHIVWRDMEYYFGAEFNAKAALHMIETTEVKRYNSSYTGQIGKVLNIKAIKANFPKIKTNLFDKMFKYSSRGPIIYSQRKEFQNVYSYDVVSAYAALLLEQEYPYEFIRTEHIVKSAKCHYGRVTIKGLRYKHLHFYPLYLAREIVGRNIISDAKSIMAADEISFYCFLEMELPIIKLGYTYESLTIDDMYYAKTKPLPEESKKTIREYFDQKAQYKGTDDYDSYKRMLNRFFGFFMTTKNNGKSIRDRSIPYQIGLYIISGQRSIMCKFIKKVGINHVVAAHTDGIKVDYDCSAIVEELNKSRDIYKNMGHWEPEEFFEKIEYFSNVQAKYISDGKLGMKHGGTSKEDIEEFLSYADYDEIDFDTEFEKTLNKYIKVCKYGTYIYKYKEMLSFRSMAEGEINPSSQIKILKEG